MERVFQYQESKCTNYSKYDKQSKGLENYLHNIYSNCIVQYNASRFGICNITSITNIASGTVLYIQAIYLYSKVCYNIFMHILQIFCRWTLAGTTIWSSLEYYRGKGFHKI